MPAFLQVTDTHAPVYVRKCDSSEQGTFFHCSVVQFWHSCAHCWSFFTQGHFYMQVGKQTFKHPISRWAPLPQSHSFSEQWGEPGVNSGNMAAARVLPPQCIYLIGIIYMNVWIKSKESSESFQTSGVCMVRMANKVYQKSNHKRGCYAFDLSWILSDLLHREHYFVSLQLQSRCRVSGATSRPYQEVHSSSKDPSLHGNRSW